MVDRRSGTGQSAHQFVDSVYISVFSWRREAPLTSPDGSVVVSFTEKMSKDDIPVEWHGMCPLCEMSFASAPASFARNLVLCGLLDI
jgi:hypothetical protein